MPRHRPLQARHHELDGAQPGGHGALESMAIKDPLAREIHIKISGCPNGCGQHHVATIGFYGASIKVGEHAIPAYIPHAGGNFEGDGVRFGERLKSPPRQARARRGRALAPSLRKRARGGRDVQPVRRARRHRDAREPVKDLSMPAEFCLETMNQFIDWNRSVPFQVIRGEGECAV